VKRTAIVFLALAITSLADACFAGQGSSQIATPAQKKAWADCQSLYRGQRFYMNKFRYAMIEQCFKNATGMYPARLQLNCRIRGC
jgi:hypothetical protein